MRFVLSTLLLALLGTGCVRSKAGPSVPVAAPAQTKVVKPDQPAKAVKIKSTLPQKPTVTAMNTLAGKVVLVNDALRFVVVDFSVGRKPVPGQRLGVYRKEQKIGEVKISGQARDVNLAADLVAGEIKLGDDVRED